ncbi:MAG: primosomal protein N' [Candidatus Neomarinimicrobiota bacterium]
MTEPEIKYVDVCFPIALRRSFSYQVPKEWAVELFPGQRVVAPLRKTAAVGYILRIYSRKPEGFETKDILEIIDFQPVFPSELFTFLQKVSEYYLSPFGKVLSAAIPPEYQTQKSRKLAVVRDAESEIPLEYEALYRKIEEKGEILLSGLKHTFDNEILRKGVALLKRLGLITEYPVFHQRHQRGLIEKSIHLAPDFSTTPEALSAMQKKSPRQWELLDALLKQNGEMSGKEMKAFSPACIQALAGKGIISVRQTDVSLDRLWSEFNEKKKDISLMPEQESAFQIMKTAVDAGKFSPFLLEGVTGSGKTEVYIRLIEYALSIGKSAIVLVPEITLTTHLAARFRGAFQDKIAIWHSQLGQAQRGSVWQAILRGDFPVVIGARSALFLPLQNLGLIIVDEEQDSSFKQTGQEPKYHARDAAMLRGVESRSVVVLGSATPSLETQYNAITGKFQKIDLPKRFAKSPTALIHVVDMKEEWRMTGVYNNPISGFLLDKIKEKVALGQQVLLMQNRRGYSNILLCAECGWSPVCRNCDVSLTYHMKSNRIQCHYCNLIQHPPTSCPQCGGTRFLYPGYGTQRVEAALTEVLAGYSISRLDIDTARERGFSLNVMNQFEQNQISVLVGTQMIAKGLDFPNVSLVGILNADIGLYLPDFRARERVFQLLYQVSGRAGRGDIQGEIVLQTFNPQDFTIQCATQQNLSKFSNCELNERNPLNYPPFSRLALVSISDLNSQRAADVADEVAEFLQRKKKHIALLGPAPAPLGKIKNRYRYSIILKSRKDRDPNGIQLRGLLHSLIVSPSWEEFNRRARIGIDIDPLDLL